MKNTIFEMKNILERINNVEEVEDRFTNIEDGVVEDRHTIKMAIRKKIHQNGDKQYTKCKV